MGAFIQSFKDGSITKNQNGTYNFVKNNKVVSTHKTVKELADSQTTKPKTTSKKSTKRVVETDTTTPDTES